MSDDPYDQAARQRPVCDETPLRPDEFPPELQAALRSMSKRGPVVDMASGETVAKDGRLIGGDDLYETLRKTAEGDWGREAAVGLLASHGRWLTTLEEHGYLDDGTDDEDDYMYDDENGQIMSDVLYVKWQEVFDVLTRTTAAARKGAERVLLVGTNTERNMLLIACSLAAGTAVSLSRAFDSLDENNRLLVLHAIAHSMGGRRYAETVVPLRLGVE